MGKTSYEVKKRWLDKTYQPFTVNFRYDTDQKLIDFIEENKEKYGTTPLFRDAIELLMEEWNK